MRSAPNFRLWEPFVHPALPTHEYWLSTYSRSGPLPNAAHVPVPVPMLTVGVARSREISPSGRGHAPGMPNASPQHADVEPSGPTLVCWRVKPNTPSTTNVDERMEVAAHEPLLTSDLNTRPRLRGLIWAPPGSGKIPLLFSWFGM